MFAIASVLSGLQAVSAKDLEITEVLRELVAQSHAQDADSAASMLVDWLAAGLANRSDGRSGPVIDLLGRVANGNVPTPVDVLLSAKGFQNLLSRLVDLQDEWLGGDDVPFLFRVSDGRPVLVRLQDAIGTTPVKFALSAKRGTQLGSTDGLNLAINARVSATLEIQIPKLESLKDRYGLERFGAGRAAMAVIATGEFGAGADWSIGLAAFSAKAQFLRRLSAVYDFPAARTSIGALVSISNNVAKGLGPQSINQALSVAGEDGLKLIQIDRARGFTFALGFEQGLSFVDVRTVSVDGKQSPITLNAGATFKLGVSHQENRQRQLRISRHAGGGVLLASTLTDTEETAVNVGFEAGFTITGWGDIAKSLAEANLPKAEALLAKLGDAATPGKWLRQKIKDALDFVPDDLAPLAQLITGELDAAQAQAQIASRITDLLDSKVSLWQAVDHSNVDVLAQSLAEALTPLASLQPLRAKLTAALVKALNHSSLLDDALAKLKALIPTTKGPLDELTKLLAQDKVQKADDLVKPLLDFLSKYEAFREKLIAGADKLAKLRFGIAINHARKMVAADTLETQFVIPIAALGTAVAKADLEAWVTGGRFSNASLPFGVPQANDAWKIVSTRSSESTTRVRLDLALVDASTEDLLKSDTRVEVGPGGVLVALTRAAAKKVAKNSWSDEVVTASGATVLDALSPHLPMTELSFDLEFEDQRFKETELNSILASLSRLGASGFPQNVTDDIWTDWEVLRKKQGVKAPKAKLRVGLSIDEPQRAKLHALGSNQAQTIRRAELAAALVQATKQRPERDVAIALQKLGYEGDAAAEFARAWPRFARWLKYNGPKAVGQIISTENLPGSESVKTHVSRAVNALVGATRVVVAIERVLSYAANRSAASNELDSRIQKLRRAHAGLQDYEYAFLASKSLADEYAEQGRDVAKALGRALSAADVYLDMNNNVPVNTLILMSFLSKACGAQLVGEVVDAS